MVLKGNVTDREFNKFQETNTGEHAVRVIPFGTLDIPLDADFIQAAYPDTLTEVYTYRTGGASGAILKVITVTYTDVSKNDLASVSWT